MSAEANGPPSRELDLEIVARNVRLLMAERGWNQEELALAAKVSPTTISRLLRGRISQPRLHEFWRIAHALGRTLPDLSRELVLIYGDERKEEY